VGKQRQDAGHHQHAKDASGYQVGRKGVGYKHQHEQEHKDEQPSIGGGQELVEPVQRPDLALELPPIVWFFLQRVVLLLQ
jgi:hypothetical protein